jgi:predicted GIY-YIG superfamily endonuclease
MGAFVYMLRCADASYYVGRATGDDLSKRIAEHETGAYPGYTAQSYSYGLSALIGSPMQSQLKESSRAGVGLRKKP